MRIYSPGSLSHGQNSESQKAEGYLQEHNFLTNTAPVPSHWNCEGQGQPHVRVRLSTARCHPSRTSTSTPLPRAGLPFRVASVRLCIAYPGQIDGSASAFCSRSRHMMYAYLR